MLLVLNLGFCQNLVFANQNFKNYLLLENTVDLNGDEFADAMIDVNGDNEIQVTEIINIENLAIGSNLYLINSINDLNQFTNLKKLSIWGGFQGLTEISNLNLNSLEHIRIDNIDIMTEIDLSTLPNLDSILIHGLNGLNNLNVQNGTEAQIFSLFYTYFNSGCVDPISSEYNIVAEHLLNGGAPTTICTLRIAEQQKEETFIYPNPASNQIRIKSDLSINLATIYDMSGKLVYRSLISNEIINITALTSGLFLLVLETENGLKSQHKILIE